MSNLEKAKEIVKTYYSVASCGIFDSGNIVGDRMSTIYKGEGLTIDVCYNYEYFEVFGLSNADFEELERYYDSLAESEGKDMGQVTYKDKFKEVFGVEPKDDYDALACPLAVGLMTEEECCHQEICNECLQKFWNSEYKPLKAESEGRKNMKVLIDISEDDFKLIFARANTVGGSSSDFLIANGTPLNDVLDKIRAEIKEAPEKWWYGENKDCFVKLLDVLQIIDKHKEESDGSSHE